MIRSFPVHLATLASMVLVAPGTAFPSRVDPPAAVAPADDVAKAKARIAELEAEVAALKNELAALKAQLAPASPAPAAPAPPADADPFASLGAIRRALEAEYTRPLAELLPGPDDQAAAAIFRRELERWVAGMNRSFRRPVRWQGRLVKSEPQGDRLVVTIAPVDPISGDSLGDEFTATLEPRIARRLSNSARANVGEAPWTLVGTFIPELRFRPDRMERGDFDNPPLIGPGAEFLWRLEVESFTPARREKPAEPSSPAGPSR